MILNWKSQNTIELLSTDVVSEYSVGINDIVVQANYGSDVAMDIVFGNYNSETKSFTAITAPLPAIAEVRPDGSGWLQWRAKIPATVLSSHGQKGLVLHAKIPTGNGLITRVTSPIFKFTVVESMLGQEYNLSSTQYDSLAAALSVLSAAAIKNLNGKTGNNVTLTGNDIKVDDNARSIQDALNYLYTYINANKPLTFIQILNVNNLDDIQALCTAAVQTVKGRTPENGDYCMVNVIDVSYWYIYNSSTKQWDQTVPQTNSPVAQNGVQGTIEGSYTETAALQRALMVKINNGDFEGIFIKDSATGIVHSLPVLMLDINNKLIKLLDGATAAPKAVGDEDGNNIKETYRTVEDSYSKSEVYKKTETYNKEEADSKFALKGIFKNLYITSSGFAESLPILSTPQFTKTVASISSQLIFDIASDLNLNIEFSNNDILLLNLQMAFSVVNTFALTARVYVKKGDVKTYIGTYTQNITPITAGAGYPINPYTDMRIFLNEIAEGNVVSLTADDKLGLEVYMQFESSISTGVRIYSNGTYPSYIEAQANHIRIDTAQLGEGSVITSKIADGAVTEDKIDPSIIDTINSGGSALPIAQAAQETANTALTAASSAQSEASQASSDVVALAGQLSGKLDKSGGSLTGPLFLAGAPSQANEAVTKAYADALAVGLQIKAPVRLATTANITLSGLQEIDGVMTASGDRVLVKNQTNANQNGVYLANTSTWDRALDCNTTEELNRAYVYVESGNTQAGYSYTLGAVTGTLESVMLNWNVFTKTVPIAVEGIDGAKVEQITANKYTVSVEDGGVNNAKIADGAVGTSKLQDGAVDNIKLADSSVTTSKIQDGSVNNTKLADNAVGTSKLQDGVVTGIKIANSVITPAKTTFMPATNPSNNRLLAADGNGNVKDSGYSVQTGTDLTLATTTIPTSAQVSKRTEELQTQIEELQNDPVNWDEVQNKPSSYPPTYHNHSASEISSGVLNAARLPGVTSSSQGAMSAEDKTKLDGIEAGAQVNKLEGVQANGVDLSISGKKVNITPAGIGAAPTNHTHDAATFISGVLSEARIPNLNASKITSGYLAWQRMFAYNGSSNTSKVVVFPNNITIQWGTDTPSGSSSTWSTVSFKQAFEDSNYTVLVTFGSDGVASNFHGYIQPSYKYTSSFTYRGWGGNQSQWIAIGISNHF